MPERLAVLLLLMTCSLDLVHPESADNWDKCGGRLERALDSIRRDSSRKNRLEDEDQKLVYQQKLKSAPLEMVVSHIAVKVAQDLRVRGLGPWAKVDRCIYEPSNNSVQTRVIFNDLAVSGLVSLMPRSQNVDVAGESCRMSLRLRRAGVEFFTNPIARGRGQMRIRTESSFLEPRFASIYAYGCRPTRHDKQIKRQDKWPPYATSRPADDITLVQSATTAESLYMNEDYESPEPRELAAVSTDEDVVILNENKSPSSFYSADPRLGIWRDNSWITKSRRSFSDTKPRRLRRESAQAANKSDYLAANDSLNFRMTKLLDQIQEHSTNKKSARQPREIFLDDDDDAMEDSDSLARDWQSRDNVAREMEDIFLRGASEALTRYIEKQLHPAIKETLMLSMGYTISYGK